MSRNNRKLNAGPPFRPRRFFFATARRSWWRAGGYPAAGTVSGPAGHHRSL